MRPPLQSFGVGRRSWTRSSSTVRSSGDTASALLGQVVIDALAAHLARVGADGPLWPTQTGERLQYRRWRREWDAARKPLKLEFTSHDLRHHAASLLISGGASVQMVSSFLGHKDATITLRTYSHLFHGDEDRTRAIMDAGLSALEDSLRTANVQEG